MAAVYSSGFEPDPHDSIDVLAFVLCPAGAFAPGAGRREMAAVEQLIAPAKAEAVRRWAEARRARVAN